jgi:hypothetical protein
MIGETALALASVSCFRSLRHIRPGGGGGGVRTDDLNSGLPWTSRCSSSDDEMSCARSQSGVLLSAATRPGPATHHSPGLVM